MSNSTDETELALRVEALETLVIILAKHLCGVPSVRAWVNDEIRENAEALEGLGDAAKAKALLALKHDLTNELC